MVTHPQLSLAAGAIRGWDRRNQFYFQMLGSLAKHANFDLEKPFDRLTERAQQIILYGSGDDPIPFTYLSDRGKPTMKIGSSDGQPPPARAAKNGASSRAVARFICAVAAAES